jgi:DnaJ-class molecular chaperone
MTNKFIYLKEVICPHCMGTGADSPDDMKECDKC